MARPARIGLNRISNGRGHSRREPEAAPRRSAIEDETMAEGTPINAAQLFSDDASEFFIDAGVPRYNRRLTDKILAAFNHAYAMGEMDLARNLWECLVAAEKLG